MSSRINIYINRRGWNYSKHITKYGLLYPVDYLGYVIRLGSLQVEKTKMESLQDAESQPVKTYIRFLLICGLSEILIMKSSIYTRKAFQLKGDSNM